MNPIHLDNPHTWPIVLTVCLAQMKFAWIVFFAKLAAWFSSCAGAMAASTIYFDSAYPDRERRKHIFGGELFVFSSRRSTLALCRFAQSLIRKAFAPLEPQTAQNRLSVQEFTKIIARVKPEFAHNPTVKTQIKNILDEFGCDPRKVYYDVPKMRFVTSDGYLNKGLAQAWHPHRDTWYSAPSCQVNWWVPIYEIASQSAMAIHPQYWGRTVENDSAKYNYYRENRAKLDSSLHDPAKPDPRVLPRPLQPIDADTQRRIVCPVGGLIMFSAAHLHSTVTNTSGLTRFSFDFRTVHEDDLRSREGAPRIDEQCTGTSLRDFKRATDHARLPDDLIALYDDNTAHDGGDLVFAPVK